MDYNRLAELCLPGIDKTPDYWEKQFPARIFRARALTQESFSILASRLSRLRSRRRWNSSVLLARLNQ